MASILDPTTFQVKIREEHIVKNVKTLNETTLKISNVTNVDRRIVTCPQTTSIDIININGVNPSSGTFPSSSVKYVRITNLDDTYNLIASFSSSNNEYWGQKILPTSSLIMSNTTVTGSNFNGSLSSNIEAISLYAVSGSIDVEYIVVNA